MPFPLTSVANDRDDVPLRGKTLIAQHNQMVADMVYALRNGLNKATVATLPVVAIATVTSQLKTTNASTFLSANLLKALAGSDNFWTLTGGVLAISSFRKYRLLVSGAGVASVQASTDAATAAACVFTTAPADGLAIMGIATIATDGTHTFTPATTLLGAAGITATFIDGSDSSELLAQQITF